MQSSEQSDAAVARAAIRRLAERRLAPTPDNYAQAWVACGGEAPATAAIARTAQVALRLLADRGEMAASLRAELVDALAEPQWESLSALVSRIEAHSITEGWRELLPSLIAALDARHPGWTQARKRDGVQRVIEVFGRNPARLRRRLSLLIESWQRRPEARPDAPDHDLRDDGVGSIDGNALGAQAAAPEPLASGDDSLRRRLDDTERALAETRRLLLALCDSVAALADDGSWLRGQMDVVRDTLQQSGDRRSVSIARHMIEDATLAQRHLVERKREALRQLREALSGAAGQVAGLGDSTGEFAGRLARWAEEIERGDSVEALEALTAGLISEARAMKASVVDAHEGFIATHRRAQDLEAEVGRLERELAETSHSMLTDHLTQALNRRGLEDAWSTARVHARRAGQPLSIALLDVDDFKRLNDAFGHLAGDGALKHLARLLQSRLRPHDSVARWGGEEFVLLLPGSDATSAIVVMQRLQRELTREAYLHENRQVFLTFSAGVAEMRSDETFEALAARADEAMYLAKRAGKNCVIAA